MRDPGEDPAVTPTPATVALAFLFPAACFLLVWGAWKAAELLTRGPE